MKDTKRRLLWNPKPSGGAADFLGRFDRHLVLYTPSYGGASKMADHRRLSHHIPVRPGSSRPSRTICRVTDSFTGIDIPAEGVAIQFATPFNGGPDGANIPNLQITISGALAGDDVVLSSQSLSGFFVQVLNGGAGVARSLNIIAQGY